MEWRIVIPLKLPSLNDYVRANRSNRYEGAAMKKQCERAISYYLRTLPTFQTPIMIHFHWIEKTAQRDYDNIAFAKKFILDALVKAGKLRNDDRRFVTGFRDTFARGNCWRVELTITEDCI